MIVELQRRKSVRFVRKSDPTLLSITIIFRRRPPLIENDTRRVRFRDSAQTKLYAHKTQ